MHVCLRLCIDGLTMVRLSDKAENTRKRTELIGPKQCVTPTNYLIEIFLYIDSSETRCLSSTRQMYLVHELNIKLMPN